MAQSAAFFGRGLRGLLSGRSLRNWLRLLDLHGLSLSSLLLFVESGALLFQHVQQGLRGLENLVKGSLGLRNRSVVFTPSGILLLQAMVDFLESDVELVHLLFNVSLLGLVLHDVLLDLCSLVLDHFNLLDQVGVRIREDRTLHKRTQLES